MPIAAAAQTTLAQNRSGDQADGAPESRQTRMLFAGDYGVIGDGIADDTTAVQAFLDHCLAAGGRTACFDAMVVRTTGPLFARGVGIVFEPFAHSGTSAPGFHPEGAGYTALTVTGAVLDFAVSVFGRERAELSDDGSLGADRRSRINGVAFGIAQQPFLASVVRSIRVFGLAGFGVRFTRCWDTTFLAVSVEECGLRNVPAFDVTADATATCNESVWVRIQVESAVGQAIRIDPRTLSCTFDKIHSERAIAIAGAQTWLLGGAAVYHSVRLSARNPAQASAGVSSNQATLSNLRAEDLVVAIDASGGCIVLVNPTGTLTPSRDQSGRVTVTGGQFRAMNLGGGWTITGAAIAELEVGFMPPGLGSSVTGSVIGLLSARPGTADGQLIVAGCEVRALNVSNGQAGAFHQLMLTEGTRMTAQDGRINWRSGQLTVAATGGITGDLHLYGGELRVDGQVAGALVVHGSQRGSAGDAATVTGSVTGWGPPARAGTPGEWSRNLNTEVGQGEQPFVAGWRYGKGMWHAVRVDVDDRT